MFLLALQTGLTKLVAVVLRCEVYLWVAQVHQAYANIVRKLTAYPTANYSSVTLTSSIRRRGVLHKCNEDFRIDEHGIIAHSESKLGDGMFRFTTVEKNTLLDLHKPFLKIRYYVSEGYSIAQDQKDRSFY